MLSLLGYAAAVYRYTAGQTAAGEAFRAWTLRGEYLCRLGRETPRASYAPEGERFTVTTRVYFQPTADVQPGDILRIGSRKYRVVGAAIKSVGGRASHIEADVTEAPEEVLP
jgi:hypothetical protein